MNQLKFAFTILLTLCARYAAADIQEVRYLADALNDIQASDVVVLDIDNTILEPGQTLGSDQWYGYLVEKYKASGLTQEQSIDHAIIDWIGVQKLTTVSPIEKQTPNLVLKTQGRAHLVMALTARPVELAAATLKQIKSVGIQFAEKYKYESGESIKLAGGVLFVGPKNNKGTVLQSFLKAQNISPARVIFVDDKEKHVKNMDAVFSQAGIANLNFRYGAADGKVKSFSPEIAEIQWEYFVKFGGALLSDREAEERLDSKPKQIENIFCQDAQFSSDHRMSIRRIGSNRFSIHFVTDLDVPGGAYSESDYLGVGSMDASQVELKVYSGERYLLTLSGRLPQLTAFGITMNCR